MSLLFRETHFQVEQSLGMANTCAVDQSSTGIYSVFGSKSYALPSFTLPLVSLMIECHSSMSELTPSCKTQDDPHQLTQSL